MTGITAVPTGATIEAPSITITPTDSAPSPTVVLLEHGPGSVQIPILLYHHVSDSGHPSRYVVSTDNFDRQIADLYQGGYRTITISHLVQATRSGAFLPERSVIITFDDGNEDVFSEAFPRMQAQGMVGVVYVIAGRLSVDGYLGPDQLRALSEAGWEIGSHGMTHRDLTSLSLPELRVEILQSRLLLQQAVGVPIESFAYPYGAVNRLVAQRVADYGYTCGVGLGNGVIHGPSTRYYVERRDVSGFLDPDGFLPLLAPLQ